VVTSANTYSFFGVIPPSIADIMPIVGTAVAIDSGFVLKDPLEHLIVIVTLYNSNDKSCITKNILISEY